MWTPTRLVRRRGGGHKLPSSHAKRGLPPLVQEIVQLVSDSLEHRCDLNLHTFEPQYCTTNDVFALGSLVFKKYREHEAYLVETQVLRARDQFRFCMPRIFFSHHSKTLGSWNVFERVDGVTLADACPGGPTLELLVDMMVNALIEFETRMRFVPNVTFTRWLWVQGVAPLAKFCREHAASLLSDMLLDIASQSDALVENLDAVPCFDLYARNIIWTIAEGSMKVTFVDFDKASRLVPPGEQLSHLAMIPGLRPILPRAISRYAELSGWSMALVQRIVDVSCFFRALSGIRDSIPWGREGRGDLGGRDPHADARGETLQHSIAEAQRLSGVVCAAIGRGRGADVKLRKALSQIRLTVDAHR